MTFMAHSLGCLESRAGRRAPANLSKSRASHGGCAGSAVGRRALSVCYASVKTFQSGAGASGRRQGLLHASDRIPGVVPALADLPERIADRVRVAAAQAPEF